MRLSASQARAFAFSTTHRSCLSHLAANCILLLIPASSYYFADGRVGAATEPPDRPARRASGTRTRTMGAVVYWGWFKFKHYACSKLNWNTGGGPAHGRRAQVPQRVRRTGFKEIEQKYNRIG